MVQETRYPAPLLVLGIDHDEAAIWFSRNGVESYAAPHELAILRRSVAHLGSTVWDGIRLDESDLDTLIKAMDSPQPLYPLVDCKSCATDATTRVDGEFYCDGHAAAIRLAEDESMEAAS